jgi:hypothetical protein
VSIPPPPCFVAKLLELFKRHQTGSSSYQSVAVSYGLLNGPSMYTV